MPKYLIYYLCSNYHDKTVSMSGYETWEGVLQGTVFQRKHSGEAGAKDQRCQEQSEAPCLFIPNLLSGMLCSPTV